MGGNPEQSDNQVGLYPMAAIGFTHYCLNMKSTESSQPPNPAKTSPTKDEVARCAYAIYESQGSHPGHEVRHWLEAEAQLFGGIERETQMNPKSPLFRKES
jgi:hypothetical protein